MIRALSLGETHLPPIHFVSGYRITLGQLASLAISLGALGARITDAPPRSFDLRDFNGDPARAQAILGWRVKTDIRVGLARLIAASDEERPALRLAPERK